MQAVDNLDSIITTLLVVSRGYLHHDLPCLVLPYSPTGLMMELEAEQAYSASRVLWRDIHPCMP